MKILVPTIALLALSTSLFGGVAGKWKMAANAPDGNTYNFDLVVKEEGGKYSAVMASDRGEMPLQEVVVSGDDLSFKLMLEMGAIPFKLKAEGDNLKGTLSTPDGASGTVTGKRDGAAPAAAQAAAPASVAGKWKVLTKAPDGTEIKVTMDVTDNGGKLTGQVTTENGDVAPMTDVKLEGDIFSFKVPTDEGAWTVTGKLSGNEIKGKAQSPNGTEMNVTATKS